jgi:hypothetical protein
VEEKQALARGFFGRSIEERLLLAGLQLEPMQLSAQTYALAGSVFPLLDRWMDRGMKPDPKKWTICFIASPGPD